MITTYLPIRNSLLLCRWSAFHSFKQTGPMMQHRRFVLTLQQLPSDIDIYSTTHCSLQIDLALLDNEMGWQRKPQTCLTYILYYFIDCYNTPLPLVLVKMLILVNGQNSLITTAGSIYKVYYLALRTKSFPKPLHSLD